MKSINWFFLICLLHSKVSLPVLFIIDSVKTTRMKLIFFHPWRALSVYDEDSLVTDLPDRKRETMFVRHQEITLVWETNQHATRQRDSPSRRLRGIKCHFQVFHSRTFVALSLYLSLASLPRLRLLFDCEKLFFLCTILKASVVEFPPCFASIIGSHTVNSCRRGSFGSSFCLLFTFALLCLFFL
jgi:hypothetical protein